jgi:carbon-monoxide dehydrogenase small subunit
MTSRTSVTTSVNGRTYTREVEPRLLLSDFLRHELGLTGTHVGCEHGVCGACTILFDGESARSCLIFAVQADGHEITTVEGLAALTPNPLPPMPKGTAESKQGGEQEMRDKLHPIQQAFWEAHGLQCGYCTPGILMTLVPFLKENPDPSEDEIRHALSGNLCRCTGYQHIVDAVKLAAEKMKDGSA